MYHGNKEWCKNCKEIDLSVQNWHEGFDEFWPVHSKILKICTLMSCFLTEVYSVWAKKMYRGVIFDGTEDWWKMWMTGKTNKTILACTM